MYTKRPLFWIFESFRFVDCSAFELCYYSIDHATVSSRELLYATLFYLSVSLNYMYNSNCIGQMSILTTANSPRHLLLRLATRRHRSASARRHRCMILRSSPMHDDSAFIWRSDSYNPKSLTRLSSIFSNTSYIP